MARALGRTFAAGEQGLDAIVDRCAEMLGHRWRWVGPLARRYLRTFAGQVRPRQREITRFLEGDEGFQRACARHGKRLQVAQWILGEPVMAPAVVAGSWEIPTITTSAALADWLGLPYEWMEWLADLKGLTVKGHGSSHENGRLGHYHYRVLAKESGGARLIEAPKVRLKEVQRKLLAEMLDRVPAHPAAHGFVKGRSIQTFAGPHVGRRVVLRTDLRDFFPTFGAARVQAFFRTAGYPEAVADLLGGLVTTSAPPWVWKGVEVRAGHEVRAMYRRRHLPQGAPTSPALANSCCYRLDCRLDGLARAAGATYTRYADDLAFSGGDAFERGVERFSWHVGAILLEEGFTVNHRKTRIMRQGVRQYLAGLVTNERLNVPRRDFDALKAILANCVRRGPASQNRTGHPAFGEHLDGRVGFVETVNPARGAKLREIFNQVAW